MESEKRMKSLEMGIATRDRLLLDLKQRTKEAEAALSNCDPKKFGHEALAGASVDYIAWVHRFMTNSMAGIEQSEESEGLGLGKLYYDTTLSLDGGERMRGLFIPLSPTPVNAFGDTRQVVGASTQTDEIPGPKSGSVPVEEGAQVQSGTGASGEKVRGTNAVSSPGKTYADPEEELLANLGLFPLNSSPSVEVRDALGIQSAAERIRSSMDEIQEFVASMTQMFDVPSREQWDGRTPSGTINRYFEAPAGEMEVPGGETAGQSPTSSEVIVTYRNPKAMSPEESVSAMETTCHCEDKYGSSEVIQRRHALAEERAKQLLEKEKLEQKKIVGPTRPRPCAAAEESQSQTPASTGQGSSLPEAKCRDKSNVDGQRRGVTEPKEGGELKGAGQSVQENCRGVGADPEPAEVKSKCTQAEAKRKRVEVIDIKLDSEWKPISNGVPDNNSLLPTPSSAFPALSGMKSELFSYVVHGSRRPAEAEPQGQERLIPDKEPFPVPYAPKAGMTYGGLHKKLVDVGGASAEIPKTIKAIPFVPNKVTEEAKVKVISHIVPPKLKIRRRRHTRKRSGSVPANVNVPLDPPLSSSAACPDLHGSTPKSVRDDLRGRVDPEAGGSP